MVSTSPFKVDGIDDLIRSILEINQAVGSLCVTHRAHGIIISLVARGGGGGKELINSLAAAGTFVPSLLILLSAFVCRRIGEDTLQDMDASTS